VLRPRSAPKARIPPIYPRADPRLDRVFAQIGIPKEKPFRPDPFQLEALEAIEHADCLVTAPTGSGKTWIAERAIARVLDRGGRAWYASPLKALSNSKHVEFGAVFAPERVGILTGDRKENPEAPLIVGTTEILRNQLYDAMYRGENVRADLVVLDEAHYLGDPDRGVVWEEVMIYLPPLVPLLMLSATIGNAPQIARWLTSIRGKPCAVVEEHDRPVELVHLFLHPSGQLLPLLAPSKKGRVRLDKKVRHYLEQKNPPQFAPPGELPPFGEIIRVLLEFDLLPAIFFLKSRIDCDRALALCQERSPRRNERLADRLDELLEEHPHIARHHQLGDLRRKGVGAHHGGQLPLWKLVLETLMTEGLLDAIFATSTVSAGVNFPARSMVFFHSDRFNGQTFVPLTSTEFHQMTGRAGRRGKDRIGFAIAVPGKFMDLPHVTRLVASPPLDVLSQIRINFSMVLNLLLTYEPAQIERLLERSFATYVWEGRQPILVRHFQRHLRFLRETGYVTPTGRLTEIGRWASQLRVDQPLLIAEGLRRGVLPASDPALLAALIAAFVYDREPDERLWDDRVPRPLERALVEVQRSLQPFAVRLAHRGFETRPLYLRPAWTMYDWARGEEWTRIVRASGIAAGDLAMLVSRTADHLRHLSALGRVFPAVAATAERAIDLIMREPVTVEYA